MRDSKTTKGPINLEKPYYDDSLKPRIHKPGQDEPLAFVKKEKDGNLKNTFMLKSFALDDDKKKKPIWIYLDLRVVPQVFAEQN